MRHDKITFKDYQMNQLLLPTDLDLHIPLKHLVRVVNDALERMNIAPLLERYKGGGTSSYHPLMLLKVLVYGYTQKCFSSRKIAKALRENINYMWISGNNTPDFRTINRFRSQMRDLIDPTFKSILQFLFEEKLISYENYFLDGTKIEANANRYTYIWKKNVQRNKTKLEDKINDLLDEIQRQNDAENELYGDEDLEELGENSPIDPEKLERKMKELNEKLAGKSKTVDKLVNKIRRTYLPKLQNYYAQEQIMGPRNSYSKTDPGASFMRTKEDHLKNSQLKPCYNFQIGTENQYVLGFSVHQQASDMVCLIPHLNHLAEQSGRLPKNLCADSGYGSQENYEYLQQKAIENYAKYSTFHQELQKKIKKFRYEDFVYDEQTDQYTCPHGRKLNYLKTKLDETRTQYQVEYRIYEAENCKDCPLRAQCVNSEKNRWLSVNRRWHELKKVAYDNLCSEKGISLRKRRSIEPEPVFGRLKMNWGFRRFFLRGFDKVYIEAGLLCIAHNLSKLAIQQAR